MSTLDVAVEILRDEEFYHTFLRPFCDGVVSTNGIDAYFPCNSPEHWILNSFESFCTNAAAAKIFCDGMQKLGTPVESLWDID